MLCGFLFYPFDFSLKNDSDESDDLGDSRDSNDGILEPTTEEVFMDPIGYLNYFSIQ